MRAYRAPAKINLYLGVHAELDERGYHRVDSVMAEVGLSDEVQLSEAPELQVSFEPAISAPPEGTAVYRAAAMLAEAYGFPANLHIHVARHIPVCAGLGGASSDAAAVLRGLCELQDIDAQSAELQRIAKAIGADVPFFLFGGAAYLTGGGDELQERFMPNPLAGTPLVLVRSESPGVPTPAAYAEFDRTRPAAASLEPLLAALRRGDASATLASMSNNLQPVAFALDSACAATHAWLSVQPDIRAAMVSGSGSAVFGIAESAEAAEAVAEHARAIGHWACATALA